MSEINWMSKSFEEDAADLFLIRRGMSSISLSEADQQVELVSKSSAQPQ